MAPGFPEQLRDAFPDGTALQFVLDQTGTRSSSSLPSEKRGRTVCAREKVLAASAFAITMSRAAAATWLPSHSISMRMSIRQRLGFASSGSLSGWPVNARAVEADEGRFAGQGSEWDRMRGDAHSVQPPPARVERSHGRTLAALRRCPLGVLADPRRRRPARRAGARAGAAGTHVGRERSMVDPHGRDRRARSRVRARVLHGRRGPGRHLLVAAWFAAVAAGALVGLALDIAGAWGSLATFGPRGLLGGQFGAAAASGALWGLTVGWMPGLVARTPGAAAADAAEPLSTARRPAWLLPAAAVAVIAVVLTGVAADNARTAAIEAEVAARQQAEAAVTFGAMPDPAAPGVPVPDKADASTDVEPEWCTSEKAMLLKGEPDAATGHRGMPIRLMNFSDQPCVIEGYPDVAFGDQNQHLLAVSVEQGGSFMAQDPGPQRIEVPAGGYAVSVLGWDAASPHGALVTKTVYAAPTAGMTRGSWPIDLDIVEGSTVAITAWAIDPNPSPAG